MGKYNQKFIKKTRNQIYIKSRKKNIKICLKIKTYLIKIEDK